LSQLTLNASVVAKSVQTSYASAYLVTGSIMFLEYSCIRAFVRACMSPEQTLIAMFVPCTFVVVI